LNWPVSLAGDLQPPPVSPVVQDKPALHWHDGTWSLVGLICIGRWQLEQFLRRHREEAAVERSLEIAVIRGDWVVNGHQVGARRKCSLNLKLGQGGNNFRKDMPTAQHRLANGHEISNAMVAIANEL
jgi:hypothetical protein